MDHHRGPQQGDPLPLLLFILAIDPLHRLITMITDKSILASLPGKKLKLCVSFYADDALIFSNPDRQEIDKLLQIWKQFGDTSEHT